MNRELRRKFSFMAGTVEAQHAGLEHPRGAKQISRIGHRRRTGREGEGLFDKMNGIGAHEVVIESPNILRRSPRCPSVMWRTFCGANRDRMLD